jgi:hypothetical protein
MKTMDIDNNVGGVAIESTRLLDSMTLRLADLLWSGDALMTCGEVASAMVQEFGENAVVAHKLYLESNAGSEVS